MLRSHKTPVALLHFNQQELAFWHVNQWIWYSDIWLVSNFIGCHGHEGTYTPNTSKDLAIVNNIEFLFSPFVIMMHHRGTSFIRNWKEKVPQKLNRAWALEKALHHLQQIIEKTWVIEVLDYEESTSFCYSAFSLFYLSTSQWTEPCMWHDVEVVLIFIHMWLLDAARTLQVCNQTSQKILTTRNHYICITITTLAEVYKPTAHFFTAI